MWKGRKGKLGRDGRGGGEVISGLLPRSFLLFFARYTIPSGALSFPQYMHSLEGSALQGGRGAYRFLFQLVVLRRYRIPTQKC